MDDPRFKHVATDPRFKVVPRRARKVNIDSRFQSMFTDKKFKVNYAVDRKGRKVNQTSSEDLRKYYQIEDEDGQKGESLPANDSDSEEAPDDSTDNDHPDSDSSSTDLEEYAFNEGEGLADEVVHSWGRGEEGTGGVVHSEDTTNRLAVCNLDWDRVGATDLYVLLSSFTPSGGVITMVTIYPSDYGLECMSREDELGPAELIQQQEGAESSEGSGYSVERLRQYQLKRLKYYYAVVECDSVSTADHLYQQCDGLEYEHSGGLLDLRFIPDHMMFHDRQAKSSANESTVSVGYTPVNFTSSALQQSKVHLTWDETDPKRLQTTMRKFTKTDIQSMDFNAYLGGSSDSEEEGGADYCGQEDQITKYRTLLNDDQESQGQDKPREEMEITWEPGLKESAQELVQRKQAEKMAAGETVWEKYLREKKKKKVKSMNGDDPHQGGVEELGFDDPFFQHDVTKSTARSKTTKTLLKVSQEDQDRVEKDKNELELLVLESDDEKQHFSLKSILDGEKDGNKRHRKRKRNTQESKPVDKFEVDVSDPRFEALYNSHHYAPDPANPQYKPTKAMTAIMTEMGRRRKDRKKHNYQNHSKTSDSSLGLLVKSVKNNTSAFNEHWKKRAKVKQRR